MTAHAEAAHATHDDSKGHPSPGHPSRRQAATDRLLPRAADGSVLPLARLIDHVAAFGPLPAHLGPDSSATLLAEIDRSGLRGRGGGWFPTARKMQAVIDRAADRSLFANRRPVVVVNAMEGEPLSRKDAVLIGHVPHLVLDGACVAAAAVRATSAVIAVHRDSSLVAVLERAIGERDDDIAIELVTPPARYVASEESALSHWIGDGLATPVFGTRPFERGVRGRPTLVLNAETMANLALIARHGGAWFASVGDPSAPGTTLVTVSGHVRRAGVVEIPTGLPVCELIERCGGLVGPVSGALTGGYGGAWASPDALLAARWSPDDVAATGGVIGAGILFLHAAERCGVSELARVARWMAGESAGQCGPCRFGLPAIADDLDALTGSPTTSDTHDALQRHLAMTTGRGGCRLPDGLVRFVGTGLTVFADAVAAHRAGSCLAGSMPAHRTGSVLPVPGARRAPVDRPGKELR